IRYATAQRVPHSVPSQVPLRYPRGDPEELLAGAGRCTAGLSQESTATGGVVRCPRRTAARSEAARPRRRDRLVRRPGGEADRQPADLDEARARSEIDGLGRRAPSFRVRFGLLRPVAGGAPGGTLAGEAPPAPLRAGVAALGAPGDVAGPASRGARC